MKNKAILLMAFIVLAGCADKFATAKIAVQSGRAATNMTQVGFDVAEKAKRLECNTFVCSKLYPDQKEKFDECMNLDHSTNADWKTCFAAMEKALKVWGQSKKTANSAFDAAEAGIKVAEQSKAGEAIDWVTPLRRGACLIAQCLEFLPEKYKAKVKFILNMMKNFGCKE